MKNISKLLVLLFSLIGCISCQESETEKAILKSEVTANDLLPLSATSFVLSEEKSEENFDSLTWTPTDYGFQSAVNYTVQFDVEGNAFATPINLANTFELTSGFTVGNINKSLLEKGVAGGTAVNVEFRVVSLINEEVAEVYSSVEKVEITPYAPSVLSPLYINGDDQGWNFDTSLDFNVLGIGEFELIGTFTNGSYFRFFEEKSWEASQLGYGDFEVVDANLTEAGDGDDNFIFSGTTGVYTMTVSYATKTITMTAASTPELYIVGDQNGWSFDAVTWLGGGKYEGTVTITNGQIFRFFTVDGDWGSQQYNYTYFMDGTLSDNLTGTTEGDANFTYVGADGTYKYTVDLYSKSFIIQE
ncbi:hypothetical protein EI427_21860 [Flammeovirga pectinis]|uniref:SusE outer membrane protein domain-containing protein n=1 Tax=Flammeovirga pectinis TaxID=2494373 RepID=A0A3S9P9M5_9BACT|nr:SusE domain-containing protein [Flammeovirga pectinis]AZQ64874.1 hypothetical protein EI427_21860 [Flammeovirga pectinis]